ncbi:MAG: hypothetical protein RJB42_371, partial [Bacteroidota bacterium]
IRHNKKDNSIMLNVFVDDFKAYLDTLPKNEGWIRLRIFERQEVDAKGFTHDMQVIVTKTEG